MDGTAWDRLVERLTLGRNRRSLLAGLTGASLIGGDGGHPGDAFAKKKKKVTVCRNGQTLSVTKKKKQKHLLPGDTPGKCPEPGTTSTPGSTTSTTSTTSGPFCPDVKPTDNLQAAINVAEPGSTLRLCPGTFRVTSTLLIEKDLILAGAGADATILDGERQVRVLAVGGERTVTVRDLTITRGKAPGEERGGGIVNSGDLTLHRMTVSFCDAEKGGGVALFLGSTLTMLASTIERNTALDDGGGILNDGTVTMNEGSFVTGNTAGSRGGGIMTIVGRLTMNAGSFVTENTALGGSEGGIGGFGDHVTLNNGSVVAGNEPNDCDTESGACS
jgi:hypothetical protein